jgi:hypothetical protein
MHNVDWLRPFVKLLVCTSKTQGCKTTSNCYPTPYKRKNNQHRGILWVERHLETAFHKEKWGKGEIRVGGKERTKIKIKNGEVLMYKLNILTSAQVVCNIMVCKCEVESTWNCILKRSIYI